MGYPTKIATCCYCGTRAALVLSGRERHELSCSACGAPLHDLKMLRKPRAEDPRRTSTPTMVQPKPRPKKSKKRRKPLLGRLFEEAFDAIEDILD